MNLHQDIREFVRKLPTVQPAMNMYWSLFAKVYGPNWDEWTEEEKRGLRTAVAFLTKNEDALRKLVSIRVNYNTFLQRIGLQMPELGGMQQFLNEIYKKQEIPVGSIVTEWLQTVHAEFCQRGFGSVSGKGTSASSSGPRNLCANQAKLFNAVLLTVEEQLAEKEAVSKALVPVYTGTPAKKTYGVFGYMLVLAVFLGLIVALMVANRSIKASKRAAIEAYKTTIRSYQERVTILEGKLADLQTYLESTKEDFKKQEQMFNIQRTFFLYIANRMNTSNVSLKKQLSTAIRKNMKAMKENATLKQTLGFQNESITELLKMGEKKDKDLDTLQQLLKDTEKTAALSIMSLREKLEQQIRDTQELTIKHITHAAGFQKQVLRKQMLSAELMDNLYEVIAEHRKMVEQNLTLFEIVAKYLLHGDAEVKGNLKAVKKLEAKMKELGASAKKDAESIQNLYYSLASPLDVKALRKNLEKSLDQFQGSALLSDTYVSEVRNVIKYLTGDAEDYYPIRTRRARSLMTKFSSFMKESHSTATEKPYTSASRNLPSATSTAVPVAKNAPKRYTKSLPVPPRPRTIT